MTLTELLAQIGYRTRVRRKQWPRHNYFTPHYTARGTVYGTDNYADHFEVPVSAGSYSVMDDWEVYTEPTYVEQLTDELVRAGIVDTDEAQFLTDILWEGINARPDAYRAIEKGVYGGRRKQCN